MPSLISIYEPYMIDHEKESSEERLYIGDFIRFIRVLESILFQTIGYPNIKTFFSTYYTTNFC